MHLSKLIECTTLWVNPNVNYRLWLVMRYQYGLISCNKCATVVEDADNGGRYSCMGSRDKLCAFLSVLLWVLNFSEKLKSFLKKKTWSREKYEIWCVIYNILLGKCIFGFIYEMVASQVTRWIKNLPAMQETKETWVWSLGQKDPLEKGMATHTRILALRIPWTEEPGGL